MSLLSLVIAACRSPGINLDAPNAVATSTNETVLRLMQIVNEEGKDLAQRGAWQALQLQASFATVATESQGVLTTIAPNINYIINDTIWDTTRRRPLFGPLTPQQFQQQKSMYMTGPWYQFRVRAGLLLFVPVSAAGDACVFEYITKGWCTDVAGTASKTAYALDTDVSLLNEDIMKLGVVWRWKQGNGLDYAEDYAKYERQVANALGRDASKPVLNMGDYRYDIMPGIFVSSGSWNV